jgi:hypothetical protein
VQCQELGELSFAEVLTGRGFLDTSSAPYVGSGFSSKL